MSSQKQQSAKILARLKGLSQQLEPDEEPVLSLPAIWDSGQQAHGETCDVIITNQRLVGFYFRSFPREKLFLDTLPLDLITTVSLRQKSHEPIFRELMIATAKRSVYIRAPRNKIETLYNALQDATSSKLDMNEDSSQGPATSSQSAPVYGQQAIQVAFENSPLAILLLLIGGFLLEILGLLAWSKLGGSAIGLPLCIAGLVAVGTAIYLQRQRRLQR